MTNKYTFDEEDIIVLSEMFSVLSEPNKLKMILLLKANEKLCVCEVAEMLDLKQNLASHHLSTLKKMGLLSSEREARKIFYKLNLQVFVDFKNKMEKYLNF